MGRKYFGTDGVRGRVGEDPLTVDFELFVDAPIPAVITGPDHQELVRCRVVDHGGIEGVVVRLVGIRRWTFHLADLGSG